VKNAEIRKQQVYLSSAMSGVADVQEELERAGLLVMADAAEKIHTRLDALFYMLEDYKKSGNEIEAAVDPDERDEDQADEPAGASVFAPMTAHDVIENFLQFITRFGLCYAPNKADVSIECLQTAIRVNAMRDVLKDAEVLHTVLPDELPSI
jgi:hypothetical protein